MKMTRLVLTFLVLCSLNQPVVAQVMSATERAAGTGILLGQAIDCGQPLEDLKPYIGYFGFLLSRDVKSKDEYDRLTKILIDSLKKTLNAPPVSDCDQVFKSIDELKRAAQVFYHSLSEAEQRMLNLDPLPPPN